MGTRMRIVERRIGDVTILQLIGRLELEDGDIVLRDTVNRLVEAGQVKLVLDMKEVTRLDSAGIGMLVSKYLTARRGGGTIKILHPDRAHRSPDGHHQADDRVRDLRRRGGGVQKLRRFVGARRIDDQRKFRRQTRPSTVNVSRHTRVLDFAPWRGPCPRGLLSALALSVGARPDSRVRAGCRGAIRRMVPACFRRHARPAIPARQTRARRASTRFARERPRPSSTASSYGAMRPQGARLSGAERRAVAEFITGKSIEGDVSGAQTGRCTTRAPLQDFAKAPRWTRMEPIDDEHSLSAGRAGGSLAVRSAAIEVEVGIRVP